MVDGNILVAHCDCVVGLGEKLGSCVVSALGDSCWSRKEICFNWNSKECLLGYATPNSLFLRHLLRRLISSARREKLLSMYVMMQKQVPLASAKNRCSYFL